MDPLSSMEIFTNSEKTINTNHPQKPKCFFLRALNRLFIISPLRLYGTKDKKNVKKKIN